MVNSSFKFALTAIASATLVACGGGGGGGGSTPDNPPVTEDCPDFATSGTQETGCVLPTTLSEDVTLESKYLWLLEETLVVGNGNLDLAASEMPSEMYTLTIEAGTEIKGSEGAAIFITRGSKIEANGTSAAPIIMSSIDDNYANDFDKAVGEWGGLVIQGFGITNKCGVDATVACNVQGEGNSGAYGGYDNTDNSGTLSYVIVTEAGAQTGTDGDELNGIGFMAVGSGTTVNNIQVNENYDDGVEFWGGAVEVTNLVLTNNGDDSIDWDNGFVGKITNAYVVHDDVKADSAIEADTDGSNFDKAPISNPEVSNFTFVAGGASQRGLRLKEGTAGQFDTGTIYGFEFSEKGLCLAPEAEGEGDSVDKIADGVLTFSSVDMSCGTSNLMFTDSAGADVEVTGVTANVLDAPAIPAFATGWTLPGTLSQSSVECPEFATKGEESGVCVLPTALSTDVTLSSDFVWLLEETLVVGNGNEVLAAGEMPSEMYTLTIDAGTQIKGEEGAAIFITRGSKIEANGTSEAPIIMSSVDANLNNDFSKSVGEWGGLVIQGFGITNKCGVDATVACNVQGEGNSGAYGGYDNTDNSGTLSYVIVTEAGAQTGADGDELNGIGFMAVGSGTTVNNIQVNENFDDGVEFWGGAVEVTNLVLTNNGDDSIDWDNGFVGKITNAYVVHDDVKADSAIEADTDGSNFDKAPISNPEVSNFTFVAGGASQRGLRLKEGTAGQFSMGTIFGFEDSAKGLCLAPEAEGEGDSVDKIADGVLTFSSVDMSCDSSNLTFTNFDTTTVTVSGVTPDLATAPAVPEFATGWTIEVE